MKAVLKKNIFKLEKSLLHYFLTFSYLIFRLTFSQVKEEIEMGNLANMYLREMIKRECWEAMTVKGRVVAAFHSPLLVSNYPMRERTHQELHELQYVTTLRHIEKEEDEVSKTIVPDNLSARTTPLPG